MGVIEADIVLESWLFGFRPCSGQGQFTLPLHCNMNDPNEAAASGLLQK